MTLELSSDVASSSKAPSADRWRWTKRLARIGTVGAVVLGLAMALDIGAPWTAELLAWLFGLPFSLPLAWTDVLSPNAQGGPAEVWGWVHVALGASAIASWTSVGVAIDLLRARRRPSDPARLAPAEDEDERYLGAAYLEVEELLRGERRAPEQQPRRRPFESLRLAGPPPFGV